jgi:hypothetical protein
MKEYTLTSAHYIIHPNERLYTREPNFMQYHASTIIQSRIRIMKHNLAFAIGSLKWTSGWMYSISSAPLGIQCTAYLEEQRQCMQQM